MQTIEEGNERLRKIHNSHEQLLRALLTHTGLAWSPDHEPSSGMGEDLSLRDASP